MSHQPPTACEYETSSGAGCPNLARIRLTFRDITAPPSLSGEPVKFFGHACFSHLEKARRVPEGIRIDSEESL